MMLLRLDSTDLASSSSSSSTRAGFGVIAFVMFKAVVIIIVGRHRRNFSSNG